MSTSFHRSSIGLGILRVVVGAVFIAHGAQKLFVFGIGGVTQSFAGMGVPLPGVAAPLVAGLEFVGGIALVVGLLTRLAALGLAFDMLGAIVLVHARNGFFLPMGVEFVLLLMGAALVLVIAGAGGYSIDGAIARRRFVPRR